MSSPGEFHLRPLLTRVEAINTLPLLDLYEIYDFAHRTINDLQSEKIQNDKRLETLQNQLNEVQATLGDKDCRIAELEARLADLLSGAGSERCMSDYGEGRQQPQSKRGDFSVKTSQDSNRKVKRTSTSTSRSSTREAE